MVYAGSRLENISRGCKAGITECLVGGGGGGGNSTCNLGVSGGMPP